MRLTAMTFNVRGSFHEDGDNNWVHRRALNIATIRKYAPDIIGFQEAQSGNLEAYAEELTDYDLELGPISIRQAENYHRVPIYWKRNRFSRVDSSGFYLSETPDFWSLSWGSTLVRAATWVRLHVLDSDTEFARAESARLIIQRLNRIAETTLPQLVMADFNTIPGSDAYQIFLDAGYVDTYTAAGHAQTANTFHGFKGDKIGATDLRLDWILVKDGLRQWKTLRCDVITDEAPPLYPSDHYPVLAELELT